MSSSQASIHICKPCKNSPVIYNCVRHLKHTKDFLSNLQLTVGFGESNYVQLLTFSRILPLKLSPSSLAQNYRASYLSTAHGGNFH